MKENCLYADILTYVHVWVCNVCVFVCVCVCVCVHARMHACVHACCVYIYMHLNEWLEDLACSHK